jgi:hypothetical protein
MSILTFINNTDNGEVVRLALYKKSLTRPDLQSVAWKIIAPPPSGGCSRVPVPQNYESFITCPGPDDDLTDPMAGSTTQRIAFGENTARFIINSSNSQDRRASAPTITQTFTDLVLNEVRIENNFGNGVWGHITMGGDEIYAPQVIWPSGIMMEDVRSTFYVAVVAQFVNKGSRLVDEEISVTESQVLDGGTMMVTGSMWKGYKLTAL